MPRTPNKNGAGPRKITIDWEKFDKYCAIQATAEEIAGVFNCSVDTIERAVMEHAGCKFAEYFKKKSGKGRASLRGKQFEKAMEGNVTMLIWLGKQYLGQSDKQALTVEVDGQADLSDEDLMAVVSREKGKGKKRG